MEVLSAFRREISKLRGQRIEDAACKLVLWLTLTLRLRLPLTISVCLQPAFFLYSSHTYSVSHMGR